MSTLYINPDRIKPKDLLWLEIQELDGVKIPCRVVSTFPRSFRAQVEILASDRRLVSVDYNRLFEEA